MATNFPTSLDSYSTKASGDTISEDHINNVQDAIEALEAKVGITTSAVDTSLDYKVNNFFVENTRRIYFYENTAPTGWTYYSTVNDCVLALKGGSDAYNVTAGNGTEYGTTWANLKAHVHTGPSHTHAFTGAAAASATQAGTDSSTGSHLVSLKNHTHVVTNY